MIKMKETDERIDEFYQIWCEGKLKFENLSLKNGCVPIIGHFNRYCGQIEDRSVIDVTPLKRFPCRQLMGSLSVFWNGDVTMCPQDFYGRFVVGNIKEESPEELWNKAELKNLREMHLSGEYGNHPLCKECKEWYLPF
jgi:radical SAM protein with 4Fe4S-binding SPASM domain